MSEYEKVIKIDNMAEKILKIYGIEPNFNTMEYQELYIYLKNSICGQ